MIGEDDMNEIIPDLSDMVNRFLSWQLPDDFSPDCGIDFEPIDHPSKPWPTGTNILNAEQAEEMILHILGDVTSYAKDGESISDCISRNRKDISKLIGMLATEMKKVDALQDELKSKA